jgi:selenocysteine-specific elongation factor
VVAAPGVVGQTILLDAAYRHLPDAQGPLKHNVSVKLFIGAAEVVARTRILGAAQINPGETGWLQLALRAPVAVGRGDRFILRRPSPGMTLGGGQVLDPHPGRRHRRFRAEVVERLQMLAQGTPADLLWQALSRLEPIAQSKLLAQSGLEKETALAALAELEAEGRVIRLEQQLVTQAGWQQLSDKLLETVARYHQENPLRLGMPREEARSRLKVSPAVLNALVEEAAQGGQLVAAETTLRDPGHEIVFTPGQQTAVAHLLRQMTANGITSPSVKECKTAVGDAVYYALLDLGQLRQLNDDVVYAAPQYAQFTQQITTYLHQHGTISAAQVRDLLGTSRKYAIALLEHLDDIKVTKRVGDDRVLA